MQVADSSKQHAVELRRDQARVDDSVRPGTWPNRLTITKRQSTLLSITHNYPSVACRVAGDTIAMLCKSEHTRNVKAVTGTRQKSSA
jgi:hypothetical protein